MNLYAVGGCLRDVYMGIPEEQVKDWDFAVEMVGSYRSARDAFDLMVSDLEGEGFVVFVKNPEFFTIRAHFPRGHKQFGKKTADFVMCRKDGYSSDNRRPDSVEKGNIYDDLARRDFTCNAIARDMRTGEVIDPYNGRQDIDKKLLRFVGDPMDRIKEDGLRALRGLRFSITKGFSLTPTAAFAVCSEETAELLSRQEPQRIWEELTKMFRSDSMATMLLLASGIPEHTRDAIFHDTKLKLLPTLGHKVPQGETDE